MRGGLAAVATPAPYLHVSLIVTGLSGVVLAGIWLIGGDQAVIRAALVIGVAGLAAGLATGWLTLAGAGLATLAGAAAGRRWSR